LESETSLNLVIIGNKPILNFISKGGYMGNASSVVGYFWYLCAMLIVDEIKDVKTAVGNGLDMDDAIQYIAALSINAVE